MIQLRLLLLSIIAFNILPNLVLAEEDKTLSPYFFVKGNQEELDSLPLKDTSVKVDIAGVIADVRVTQTYANKGSLPLEAIYIFPGSTRAAIYGMKMTIGERVRVAKIKERKKARAAYDKAKKSGQNASLLEQQRPNVFQMNVANIMPGDEIKVELEYTEFLVPTDGVYEFIYPTVVGPRYSNQKISETSRSERWVENPYLEEGEAPTSTFNIETNIHAGLAIQDVSSTSHKVNIQYLDKNKAKIALSSSDKLNANRDYILQYRLQGSKIESGLLLYEGDDENFFSLIIQPPERAAIEELPAREYLFILDVSGSMHGFPIKTAKLLLRDLLERLKPNDLFNILLFAGSSSLLSEQSLPASKSNIQQARWFIERQRGAGATELLPALKKALALTPSAGLSRTMLIISDGYVNVETDAFDLIRNNLHQTNVFAFGIGSSVNRFLIEGLARAGFGEPFVVTSPEEAPGVAKKFLEYISSPVLTNINISFGNFQVYDVEPKSIPDVLAERPIVVFGKWRGEPYGKITLQGLQGAGEFIDSLDLSAMQPSKRTKALRYLWARHKIASLADYNKLRFNEERKQQITNLGLSYNLLTKYTSFVAIDNIARDIPVSGKTVKQPVPLPKGVSKLAIGNTIPTVPEPETFALLLIVGLAFLWCVKHHFSTHHI